MSTIKENPIPSISPPLRGDVESAAQDGPSHQRLANVNSELAPQLGNRKDRVSSPNGSKIKVLVDNLVLRGFEDREREVIAASLRRELARVLVNPSKNGWVTTPHHIPIIKFDLKLSGFAGAKLATDLAQSIGKKINP